MEKLKPTYDLSRLQHVLGSVSTLAMTTRAAQDARGLGFDSQAIAAIIRSIERPMFYKSMTTYMDSSRWQDVYHVPAGDLMLYIKFQADIVTEFIVVSFKQR